MKKLLLFSVVCFWVSIVFGQSPIIIYDGESVAPNWGTVGAVTVTNDVANPYKTGLNTSDKVIKVDRHYTDEWFAGPRVWNQNINPALYNKISFLLWKNVAGNVKLEMQHQDGSNETNKFYSGQVWHNGTGWEKIEFDITHCDMIYMNNFLIVIHDADLSGDPSFGTKEMYIDDVEASFDPNYAWYHSYNVSAANEIVLYDGDGLKPWWNNLSAEVNKDAINPVTDGINASSQCASVVRKTNGNYDGGYDWSGGALWGWEKMYLNPEKYDHLSLMILKPIAGKVQLEIQQALPETKQSFTADYTTPNQWQKLVFDISNFSGDVINNILVQVHSQDYTGADMTVYWDNLTAYKENTATSVSHPNSESKIISAQVFSLTGSLLQTLREGETIHQTSLSKGIYIIKYKDNTGKITTTKVMKTY